MGQHHEKKIHFETMVSPFKCVLDQLQFLKLFVALFEEHRVLSLTSPCSQPAQLGWSLITCESSDETSKSEDN